MNAVWKGEDRRSGGPGALLPMTAAQLDAVMAIEVAAYAFPWTRGNFIDSLVGGYAARVLCAGTQGLLGYFVAMAGAGEMQQLVEEDAGVAAAPRGRREDAAVMSLRLEPSPAEAPDALD